MAGTEIRSITARQVYTNRGNPGVEAVVTTENGATGRAMCTSGISIGTHEIHFDFDGGERFRGKGVLGAVRNVNEIIAPALKGLDAANQRLIDRTQAEKDQEHLQVLIWSDAKIPDRTAGILAGAEIFGFYAPFGVAAVAAAGSGLSGFCTLAGSCLGYLCLEGMTDGEIARRIGRLFDLRPAAIVKRFGLKNPIFEATASYGHFGNRPYTQVEKVWENGREVEREIEYFGWEKLDAVDCIRKEFGL